MKITFLASGTVRSNFTYRIVALAKALHAMGYETSIIAPSADKYNNFTDEKITAIDGVKIVQPFQFVTKRLEINLLPYLFGAARALLREKPDIVYIYKPTPISIVGLVAKLFQKTPVIVDIDDLGSEVMKIEEHPWHQRKLVEWSERLAVSRADRLVVASNHLFDLYRRQFPDKPIHLMTNGVDAEWFTPQSDPPTTMQIIFMGAINRKNILEPLFDVMPNILKQIPETKLLVIGDGKDLPYFKQKSEQLNLGESVTFTGWLELSEARKHLHKGDVGYNYMPDEPTIKASNNMKTPQYMARGVLPLVSDAIDLSTSPDFGNVGYIAKANDLHALETTLLHALHDPDRIKKAERAGIFALEKFNWDRLAVAFHQWLIPQKNSERKKIYIVATAVPGDVGGPEIRNYNFIKQLSKRGDMDVEVFCISPKDPDLARKEFESKINV